ncbi:MAG: ABC transporter substrate-binding protein [Actinomycetales bacterium]|nr:ABC transporter substrate-binding protein [Actinomycetales bacterium]
MKNESGLNEYEYHLYDTLRNGDFSRRDFIRKATAMGITVPIIGSILNAVEPAVAGAASRSAHAVAPKRGGIARVGVNVPTAAPDPVMMADEGGIVTVQMAGEYLVTPDQNWNLQPVLAQSWKSTNPKTWTFTLRKGVKFHNGQTMTADDVVATFNRLTDPKVGSAALSAFNGILAKGQIEKVSDYVVTFHLSVPFVDFPYLLSPFNYNAIILPRNYKIGTFMKTGSGTGAYKVTGYTPDQGATFAKNTSYWSPGMPYLNGIKLSYYQDTATGVLDMQGGQYDYLPSITYGSGQALFSNPNVVIQRHASSGYRTIQMRTDIAPFNNVYLRRAVADSLDRKGMIKALLGGFATLGNDDYFAPVFPISKLASKQVPQRSQNIAKAKQELAQGGQPNGFAVTLTTEQYQEIPNLAVVIQQNLKSIGVDVTLNVETQTAYYGSGANQPWLSTPFGITDWGARGVPSQGITPAYTCSGTWNSAHWCNTSYDKLLGSLNASLDETTRMRIAAQMATIQHDAVPDAIAYWLDDLQAHGKNVHIGYAPSNYVNPRAMWLA